MPPLSSGPPASAPPQRFTKGFVLLLLASAALLCGAAFLPNPLRMILLVVALPIAAALLPSMLFAAARPTADPESVTSVSQNPPPAASSPETKPIPPLE